MSTSDALPSPAGGAPAAAQTAIHHGALRRILYTNNPCYAVSAALVFWGLRSSFDVRGGTLDVGLLVGCLVAYTLLLAGTAWCLLRLGGSIWEDVRTLLLLVLVLLLALSVTLDDALASNPRAGVWFNLAGACFAAVISEALLRGLRIRLPALWRGPYHAILGLFFLYPVLLSGMLQQPGSAGMQWGLFLFAPCVAAVLVTLVPAVRRGAEYVRDNGTPWGWPWFPWTVFGALVGCAALRSYYLCYSLHFVGGADTIFDWYFLAPLVWALGLLVLERGLARQSRPVQWASFAFPAMAVVLAGTTWFGGGVQERFLTLFQQTLGATPLALAVWAAIGFGAWAALRGAHASVSALCLALAALTLVDRHTRTLADISGIQQLWPLVAATVVQTAWAAARGQSPRWFLAALLAIATACAYGRGTWFLSYGLALPLHLLLACGLLIAALCRDSFAAVLKKGCGLCLAAAAIMATLGDPRFVPPVSPAIVNAYLLATVAAAWFYGRVTHTQLFAGVVLVNGAAWLLSAGAGSYEWLRPRMAGLNAVALGLAFFAAAAAISLAKAGRLRELLLRLLRITRRWLDFAPKLSHH